MTAYERFEELCKERGIAPTTAMVQAGLSKALASKWKTSADVTPNGDSLSKLSKFFNVPVDYFLRDENDNITTRDPYDIVMLTRALRNMTEQQRREVLHYAEYICPHAFNTKGD